MRTAGVLFILTVAVASGADAQVIPPVGRYVSTNGFSGYAIEVEEGGRFRTEDWYDFMLDDYPVLPSSHHKGERGRFTVSGDTMKLVYEEVIIDLAEAKAIHGDTLVWETDPAEWSLERREMLQEKDSIYHVRQLRGVAVLVAPYELTAFEMCKSAAEDIVPTENDKAVWCGGALFQSESSE